MRQALAALWALGMLLAAGNMKAQVKQKLNIEAATFYLNSASLASSAKVTLRDGEQDIVFTNVATNINATSVIVNATNGVVVESTTLQNGNNIIEALTQRARDLSDSIDVINSTTRVYIANKIDVLNRQLALLDADKMQSSENANLSVAEVAKMIELIGAKREGLLNEKVRQELKLKQVDATTAKLRQLIDAEERKGYIPGGQLVVTFYTREATRSDITITYLVPNAGWAPTYDIMADAINKPIRLFYKAQLYQNSGINWNNVKITLSTGNPSEGMQPPVMNPWALSFYRPAPAVQQVAYNNHVMTREEIQRMPTQSVSDLASTTAGTYQQQRGQGLSLGGARTSGSIYFIDGVQVRGQSSVTNYTTVSDIGVNTTFDIDLPYTLASDGKQHMVTIRKFDLPATYRYYAIPKLDNDAFLQAEVTNWEDMNLLPGQTNIFYEGNFIGQGYIDIRSTTDTMLLSLGRDKKVIVRRERDKKMRSVKMLGTNVRESFAYTISIRNTRKTPIVLIIEDQLPISNDKDIIVDETEITNAEQNEQTGKLKWTLNPGAGEAKKVSFAFSVKYPKDKYLSGLVAR